jgi:lysine 2,3-aminomutase
VRGDTAGFNTPTFVCDAPHGGGKRTVHAFEHYDRETGIAVYTSPAVNPGYFLYFDPVHFLPEETQRRWRDKTEQRQMIETAVGAARENLRLYAKASAIDATSADGVVHAGQLP